MELPVTYDEAVSFIKTLALTQPRIFAMFIALPLFNAQLIPGMLRFAVAGALGLVMVPVLAPTMAPALATLDPAMLLLLMQWSPELCPESVPVMLEQLGRLVRMAMLLAAPALVAMFLAEFGLALVSRFAPQLQVFFMAMPIKSALAMLVLMLYASSLFEYATEHVTGVGQILPWLREQWGPGR